MKMKRVSSLFVMYFFCACLCNHVLVVFGLCLDNQQSLLLQLKNNLTFSKFFIVESGAIKLKSWNTSDDCCRWRGVTCDKEGHVTGLDLSGEAISGGIGNSSSLFRLQHLQNLNLASNYLNSEIIPSGFSKLESLVYLNLSNAGYVGQIPIEISQLTRLVTLDLSCVYSSLKLEKPNLRELVQNLTSIRKLYLDRVNISAPGKESSNALLSLPNLQELSMSYCNLLGPLHSSLTKLENLSVIILGGNNLSSPVPVKFANFKNLTMLDLSNCGLNGTFPQKVFQIATLSYIDISNNDDLQGVFPDSPSRSLQTLRVGKTSFSGAIPYSIGNMSKLSELDLSYCRFNGTLPNSLSNLKELNILDLSSNEFKGFVPSFGMAKKLAQLDLSYNDLSGEIPSSSHFDGLNNLISIDLSYNSINGSIPSSLFTLPFLQVIRLSNNKFRQLDEFINLTASMLNFLDLSNNKLLGPFPVFLFQINALSELYLTSNKFSGLVELNKLLDLKNLKTLDLSYNNLTVVLDVTNSDPSFFAQLTVLHLASCNLKSFPGFLRNQSSLWHLYLSDNLIQGILPNWIWKLPSLQELNISNNLLTDLEGPFENLTTNLQILDIHNNHLKGPIPIFLESSVLYLDCSRNKFSSIIPQDLGNYLLSTRFLSLSNNNFHGSIPDSLCNASFLKVLALSINNLSGTIPPCLMMNNRSVILGVLNLQKNNLTGHIPDMFPASCSLRTLNLHGNSLHGPIPKSLSHCSILEVLDLGRNQLVGGFPCFLKKISTLCVMILRKKIFQGSLGCLKAKKSWKKLQILDVAFNNFSGKLPGKYFSTLETMVHTTSEFEHITFEVSGGAYNEDSVTVVSKAQEMVLVKILTAFTCIDISSNHYEGLIPEKLMDLKALYVLNLSNNAFSGEIPSSIENLKNLESLDLSKNNLHGEIPVQLASLTFLSYLNLSFNHLEGKISHQEPNFNHFNLLL